RHRSGRRGRATATATRTTCTPARPVTTSKAAYAPAERTRLPRPPAHRYLSRGGARTARRATTLRHNSTRAGYEARAAGAPRRRRLRAARLTHEPLGANRPGARLERREQRARLLQARSQLVHAAELGRDRRERALGIGRQLRQSPLAARHMGAERAHEPVRL